MGLFSFFRCPELFYPPQDIFLRRGLEFESAIRRGVGVGVGVGVDIGVVHNDIKIELAIAFGFFFAVSETFGLTKNLQLCRVNLS